MTVSGSLAISLYSGQKSFRKGLHVELHAVAVERHATTELQQRWEVDTIDCCSFTSLKRFTFANPGLVAVAVGWLHRRT